MSAGRFVASRRRVAALACLLSLASLALMAPPSGAAQAPEDTAQAAAEAWLGLVDAGRYGDSWEQAAALFKGVVTIDQWKQAVAGVRAPLGKMVSRKIRSRQYTERVPGGPDGKYVVLQFDTVFENKASAIETVTPMVGHDGVWRVSGYFIK